MTLTLEEAVRTGNLMEACPALAIIKQANLLTIAQLEALTDLVLEPLVEWAWLEIMKKWETGDGYSPGQTIQTWLRGKTLHDIVQDSATADEIIRLAQMIALDQSNHGLAVFMALLGKKLHVQDLPFGQLQTSALGDGRQTIRCVAL